MKVPRLAAAAMAASSLALVASGCAGTNHDTLTPQNDLVPGHAWVRVETPPGQATLFMTCIGKDLVIMDPDGNTNESANDPLCGAGYNWSWVQRSGQKPAVFEGTGSGALYGNPASDVQANSKP